MAMVWLCSERSYLANRRMRPIRVAGRRNEQRVRIELTVCQVCTAYNFNAASVQLPFFETLSRLTQWCFRL